MSGDAFDLFDPTPFLSVPLLPLQTLIVLSKALQGLMPANPPDFVKAAAGQLKTSTEAAEADMIERLRDDNEGVANADMLLDNAVDGLWVLLRDSVVGWSAYSREGLEFLDKDPLLAQSGVDMAKVRDKAARAKNIAVRLFGTGSLEMLKAKFAEQSQLTANVLGLIDADDMAADLIEITGVELLPILRRCQMAYEEMVKRRASDNKNARPDLRATRTRLRRAILRYNQAVLLLLDEDAPETVTLVEDALRPMVTLRPSKGTSAEADGDDDPPQGSEGPS